MTHEFRLVLQDLNDLVFGTVTRHEPNWNQHELNGTILVINLNRTEQTKMLIFLDSGFNFESGTGPNLTVPPLKSRSHKWC